MGRQPCDMRLYSQKATTPGSGTVSTTATGTTTPTEVEYQHQNGALSREELQLKIDEWKKLDYYNRNPQDIINA